MSDNEDDASEDVALRRIFLECLASSSSTSSLSSLPSSSSEVHVSTLVDYIRDNAFSDYRSVELLDELQTAIEEVSSDGQINWTLFKKASRRWVDKIRHSCWQDGNNNIDKNDSNDDLFKRSDDEKVNSEDVDGNIRELMNVVDNHRKPKTPRRLATVDFVNLSNVSIYSPNSDATHGCCGMSSDTTPESADDTDVGGVRCRKVERVDLRLRVRRLDEENSLLREELVRAEELSAHFQRQFDNLRRKLDHMNEKFRQLERENDEAKEILHEVEQKERDCRLSLKKTEKDRDSVAKKLEEAELERQLIATLNSELEACRKEKVDSARQAIVCRQELEEKQIECELLREKLTQVAETNATLQQSYEETLQHLRENNQELKNQIFDLHTKQSQRSLSDGISSTPPMSYLNCYMQSTPYSDSESVQLQNSLYAELKASGFSIEDNANESKLRELEEELSWYNEEIRDAVAQIENVLDKLERHRGSPDVPNLPLDSSTIVKTADIYELLQKTAKLSNVVNEIIIWKPKVKDASSQLCVDSGTFAEQRISSQYGIFIFEDCLRLANAKQNEISKIHVETNERIKSDLFDEGFSKYFRLLNEEADEPNKVEVPRIDRETVKFSPLRKGSITTPPRVDEHTIIDPIVEELDRILQCTNQTVVGPQSSNFFPTKSPKLRCIYTCTERPSGEQRATDCNYSLTDSASTSKRNLASTYVISSGGDAPSSAMMNDYLVSKEDDTGDGSMLKTIDIDDTVDMEISSCSASLLKLNHSNFTESNESEKMSNDSTSAENVKLTTSKLKKLNEISSSIINEKMSISSTAEDEDFPDANGITYRVTPNKIVRNNPRRKISVFHRSFDIDTLEPIGEPGSSETYRLTERSMTIHENNNKLNDDEIDSDDECMKKKLNINRSMMNAYRTNTKTDNSDSSESSSPEKSLINIDGDVDSSITGVPWRKAARPIVRAPKLKLPLSNGAPGFTNDYYENKSKIKNDEIYENSTSNEISRTYDSWKIVDTESNSKKISPTTKIIRPGDEIERGITFRRPSLDRKNNFSDFSLLSPEENSTVDNIPVDPKLETPSTVVPSSDGESTSCDSSPNRETPEDRALVRLTSNYRKPNNGERTYTRPHGSKWQRDGSIEMVVAGGRNGGYQMRNVNAINRKSLSVGSCGCGGGIEKGGGGIGGSDVKGRVVPPVALAMSSGEDSSDSECVSMPMRADETRSISPVVLPFVNGGFLGSSTPAPTANFDDTDENRGESGPKKFSVHKQDRIKRIYKIRRSLSESGCGRSESSCQCTASSSIPLEFNKEETRSNVFPSLTDARLHESGIANLSTSDELGGSLSEADLERKSTALSVGLVTDRVTLPRRMALSIRQRDQSEKNLACEIQKMHQDIQDLGPLCIDRESLERVERVRHQLEMITQCAHRVSCTAETLGAVHQEHRISRAIFLADRYLVVLRARCEKLASNLAETKRILTENNIVVEENNGEVGDDLPRIRYRGMPTNNRTMMARRRASIATIFRPLGNFQDVTKDGVKQRNSVSGRVTLRRPSLSAECHKWEVDKLDRTDSSSSIGELREIFEQAESRRNSREENNNVLRLDSSNLSIRDCDNSEGDGWTSTREEPFEELQPIVDGRQQFRLGQKTPVPWMTHKNFTWKPMLWCIIISFLLGFYMKHVVSTVNGCSGTPLKWWSIEEILGRYADIKNESPRPI